MNDDWLINSYKSVGSSIVDWASSARFTMFGITFNMWQIVLWTFIAAFLWWFFKKLGGDD